MDNIKVGVVILAWNHKKDTLECLDSMLRSVEISPIIIVVDNGSTDGTLETIEMLNEKRVKVLRSEKNLGVSGGYNLGLSYCFNMNCDYILITNNDVLFDKFMLNELVKFASKQTDVGIVIPKIYHYFMKNKIWMIGARWRKFPPTLKMIGYNENDSNKYKLPIQLEYVPSCCYLISRNVIDKIGYFDEGYFFYFDDWDYSLRVRNAGFSIWLNPAAIAWHKVSISTQKQPKPYIWWKQMGYSASRFYKKHCSKYEQLFGLSWLVIREFIKLHPIMAIGILLGIVKERTK
ncbi:MAG: glycosyl hydrolase [Bellilinea sp.]|nr:MAG: glycosyl hydrolase [Bellilinea sp.]